MQERLGPSLKELGFEQSQYRYDDQNFGNELWELRKGDIAVRFVRDRGDIFADFKIGDGERQPISLNRLLSELKRLVEAS
jgi:hypothetical protein